MKLIYNNQGLTLMETLLYIAIVGILMVGLISFSLAVSNSRNKTYVVQEVQANVRLSLNLINQKTRSAVGVLTPTPGNSSTSLVLDMPSPDPDLTFNLNNGILQMTEGVGTPVAVTSDEVSLTSLLFANLAVSGELDSLWLTAVFTYNNPSREKSFDYTQAIQTVFNLKY